MPAILAHHSYGKSRIRVTKVTRLADRHDVRELTIEIQLEGDFARSYTGGDNSLIIPTDTMKNVAFALAKEHSLESIEDFASTVANHFLEQHRHVDRATIGIVEQPLERIEVDGRATRTRSADCGANTNNHRPGLARRPARRVGLRRVVPPEINRIGIHRLLAQIGTRR